MKSPVDMYWLMCLHYLCWHTDKLVICVFIYIYVYWIMCVCVYTYLCILKYVCVYVYTYLCILNYVCVCVYTYLCILNYMCVCLYISMYIEVCVYLVYLCTLYNMISSVDHYIKYVFCTTWWRHNDWTHGDNNPSCWCWWWWWWDDNTL